MSNKDVDAAKAAGDDIAALAEEGPQAFLSTPPPSEDGGATQSSASIVEDGAMKDPSNAAAAPAPASEDEDEEDEPKLGAIVAAREEQEEEPAPAAESSQASRVQAGEPVRQAAASSDAPAEGSLPPAAEPSLDIPVVEGSVIQNIAPASIKQVVLRPSQQGTPIIEVSPVSISGRDALLPDSPAAPISRVGEEASIPSSAEEQSTLSDTSLGSIIEEWIRSTLTEKTLREFFCVALPFHAGLLRLLNRLDEIVNVTDDAVRHDKAAWCRGCVFTELLARGQMDQMGEHANNVHDQQWFVSRGAQAFLDGEQDEHRRHNILAALEFFQARLTEHTGMARELANAARGVEEPAPHAPERLPAVREPVQKTPAPRPDPAPPALLHRQRSIDRNMVAMIAGGAMLAASVAILVLGAMSSGPPVASSPPPATPPATQIAAQNAATATASLPEPTCVTVGSDEDLAADCTHGSQSDLGNGRLKLCGCKLY